MNRILECSPDTKILYEMPAEIMSLYSAWFDTCKAMRLRRMSSVTEFKKRAPDFIAMQIRLVSMEPADKVLRGSIGVLWANVASLTLPDDVIESMFDPDHGGAAYQQFMTNEAERRK